MPQQRMPSGSPMTTRFRCLQSVRRSLTIGVTRRSSTRESLPTWPNAVASFYCEDGLAFRLTTELRNLGHSATTSQLHGSKGAPDEEHLWLAAQQHWILIT